MYACLVRVPCLAVPILGLWQIWMNLDGPGKRKALCCGHDGLYLLQSSSCQSRFNLSKTKHTVNKKKVLLFLRVIIILIDSVTA